MGEWLLDRLLPETTASATATVAATCYWCYNNRAFYRCPVVNGACLHSVSSCTYLGPNCMV
ncbi:hypothetical protein GCM10023223_28280 [Stackebrandtia albiflava]